MYIEISFWTDLIRIKSVCEINLFFLEIFRKLLIEKYEGTPSDYLKNVIFYSSLKKISQIILEFPINFLNEFC